MVFKRSRQYLLPVICQWCGNQFSASRRDAKYCSDTCRKGSHAFSKKMNRETTRLLTLLNFWYSDTAQNGYDNDNLKVYKNQLERCARAVEILQDRVLADDARGR